MASALRQQILECRAIVNQLAQAADKQHFKSDYISRLEAFAKLVGGDDNDGDSSHFLENPPLSLLFDALIELPNALSLVEAQVSLTSTLGEQLLGTVQELTDMVEEMQADMNDLKFLSEYRDYVRALRDIVAEKVGVVSWDRLSRFLNQEGSREEACQHYTTKVKEVLQGMDLTWEEWRTLRQVADASSALFHTGESDALGYKAAIARLKTTTVPGRLQHTTAALLKALAYLSGTNAP